MKDQEKDTEQTSSTPESAVTVADRAVPVILGAVAVFVALCFMTQGTGALGQAISRLLLGLFSWVAYTIPALIALHAVFYISDRRSHRVLTRVLFSLVLILTLSSLAYILPNLGQELALEPRQFYSDGQSHVGGGLLGSLIAYLLHKVIGSVGLIVLAVLIFTLYIVFFFSGKNSVTRRVLLRMLARVAAFFASVEQDVREQRQKRQEAKKEKSRRREAERHRELAEDDYFAVDNGLEKLAIDELGILETRDSRTLEASPKLQDRVRPQAEPATTRPAEPERTAAEDAVLRRRTVYDFRGGDLSDETHSEPREDDIIYEQRQTPQEPESAPQHTADIPSYSDRADAVFTQDFDPFDIATNEARAAKPSSHAATSQTRTAPRGQDESIVNLTEEDVARARRQADFEMRKRAYLERTQARATPVPPTDEPRPQGEGKTVSVSETTAEPHHAAPPPHLSATLDKTEPACPTAPPAEVTGADAGSRPAPAPTPMPADRASTPEESAASSTTQQTSEPRYNAYNTTERQSTYQRVAAISSTLTSQPQTVTAPSQRQDASPRPTEAQPSQRRATYEVAGMAARYLTDETVTPAAGSAAPRTQTPPITPVEMSAPTATVAAAPTATATPAVSMPEMTEPAVTEAPTPDHTPAPTTNMTFGTDEWGKDSSFYRDILKNGEAARHRATAEPEQPAPTITTPTASAPELPLGAEAEELKTLHITRETLSPLSPLSPADEDELEDEELSPDTDTAVPEEETAPLARIEIPEEEQSEAVRAQRRLFPFLDEPTEGEAEDGDGDTDTAEEAEEEDEVPFDGGHIVTPPAAPAARETGSQEKAKEEKKPTKPDYSNYQYPPLDLLSPGKPNDTEEIRRESNENAEIMLRTLDSFKVSASIKGIDHGPRVTRYEIVPAMGVRVSSVLSLQNDLKLALGVEGVRMESPIPGKSAIGFEVPNKHPTTVALRDLLESEEFVAAKTKTTVCIGKDVSGIPVFGDIAKMPHVLIAGATGMGKSVCINSILISILYKARPDEVKLILIDPKKVEFAGYSGIPHLLVPVVTEAKQAAGSLMWAVEQMEKRYEMIQALAVRNIDAYNEKIARDPTLGEPMPSIIIVIDELNDLMLQVRDPVENLIMSLTQKARAAGIHLIIGTQRPSVNVITGVIKANIPSRISCKVSSAVDSRTILEHAGAESLLDKGDMLYCPVGQTQPKRVQGAFVSDGEVERIMAFLREQYKDAGYDEEAIADINRAAQRCSKKTEDNDDRQEDDDEESGQGYLRDQKFLDAVELAINQGKISTSLIQRKISIGYSRAAKFIDIMEGLGVVSEPNGQKPRDVLIDKNEWHEMLARRSLDD